MKAIETTDGRRMRQTAHEHGFPVCTDVQLGAGFFNKIKILEESAKATPPHYQTKVRDAHIPCRITDLGKYGNGII
jgi:hypothetical protein